MNRRSTVAPTADRSTSSPKPLIKRKGILESLRRWRREQQSRADFLGSRPPGTLGDLGIVVPFRLPILNRTKPILSFSGSHHPGHIGVSSISWTETPCNGPHGNIPHSPNNDRIRAIEPRHGRTSGIWRDRHPARCDLLHSCGNGSIRSDNSPF